MEVKFVNGNSEPKIHNSVSVIKPNVLKKQISKLRRTQPVDIEFEDLNYSVGEYGSGSTRSILKSLNGKFYAGELTAILGPSGSGKTTLLNILAGYVSDGVTGSIKVNSRLRQMQIFNKHSAYIMQEDLLPALLTVQELVTIAAKLKLGDHVSLKEKQLAVKEVISALALDTCANTRTENISGGQRKRLAIAVELVNNPPIIFLDEPTTGLDTFAISQCIETLRLLTSQGRTIITTIHQPSDSILYQFDQIYFVADGMCVYNGSTSNIIPFLSSINLPCPTTYNPAEYVIELIQQEEHTSTLVSASHNGKVNKRVPKALDQVKRPLLTKASRIIFEETTTEIKTTFDFPTSLWTQFYVLFARMMLQWRRNKQMIGIQIFSHTLSGVMVGGIFFGIGNNAALSYVNFKYNLGVMTFFLYTYLMTPLLLFPLEIQLLKREYFNRWYSLKAYFLALTLQNLPLLVIFGTSFLLITYLMTNQPLEFSRFFMLVLASFLVALASESLGLTLGTLLNIKNGSIVGPSLALPLMMLAVYGLGYGAAIDPFMTIVMHTSYLRYSVVAFTIALFSDRPALDCREEDLYCPYKEPKHLLRDMGMLHSSYILNIIGLALFVLLFRMTFLLALRYRLDSAFSQRSYRSKIWKRLSHVLNW